MTQNQVCLTAELELLLLFSIAIALHFVILTSIFDDLKINIYIKKSKSCLHLRIVITPDFFLVLSCIT